MLQKKLENSEISRQELRQNSELLETKVGRDAASADTGGAWMESWEVLCEQGVGGRGIFEALFLAWEGLWKHQRQ